MPTKYKIECEHDYNRFSFSQNGWLLPEHEGKIDEIRNGNLIVFHQMLPEWSKQTNGLWAPKSCLKIVPERYISVLGKGAIFVQCPKPFPGGIFVARQRWSFC